MAANVLFISEQYVKDTSYIDENVDIKLLRANILETQEVRILPILGTALYNDIKDRINAGTLSAATGYVTLVDTYVSPALKYWVLHDGAYILQYKVMNKGIVKRNSENTESVETVELDRLMSFFKDRAEFYSDRMTKYLLENSSSTLFPLYENPGDGVDTVHPKYHNYTQGLFLGDDCERTYGLPIDYGRDNYCK